MNTFDPKSLPQTKGEAEPAGFGDENRAERIAQALAAAERHCAAEGLRLTPARRRVLEILLEENRAMGAYEMLARMQKEGLGAQPPAAYRALEFLVTHNFAHRIEVANAFVACATPGEAELPAFLYCRGCGAVAQTTAPGPGGPLAGVAKATGFGIESTIVEARGLCPTCLSNSSEQAAI